MTGGLGIALMLGLQRHSSACMRADVALPKSHSRPNDLDCCMEALGGSTDGWCSISLVPLSVGDESALLNARSAMLSLVQGKKKKCNPVCS